MNLNVLRPEEYFFVITSTLLCLHTHVKTTYSVGLTVDHQHLHQRRDVTGAAAMLHIRSLHQTQESQGDPAIYSHTAFWDSGYDGRLK